VTIAWEKRLAGMPGRKTHASYFSIEEKKPVFRHQKRGSPKKKLKSRSPKEKRKRGEGDPQGDVVDKRRVLSLNPEPQEEKTPSLNERKGGVNHSEESTPTQKRASFEWKQKEGGWSK